MVEKKKIAPGSWCEKFVDPKSCLISQVMVEIYIDSDSLWVRVIKRKYKMEGETLFQLERPRLPLRKSFMKTSIVRCILEWICPWNQIWLGNTTLKEEFPRLFSLSLQKEAKINEFQLGNGTWNLLFRRSLYDWEMEEVEVLMQRLQGIVLKQNINDILIWSWSAGLCFLVKSMYLQWKLINFTRNAALDKVWKNISPPKVEIFTWLALQDRVASRSAMLYTNMLHEGQSTLCPQNVLYKWRHLNICSCTVMYPGLLVSSSGLVALAMGLPKIFGGAVYVVVR